MTGLPDLVVSTTDPTPPYEQLRRQLAALILAGLLPPGERLPPLRQLASDLGLAVGTVARTYRELENAALITSRRGGGTRVAAQLPAPPPPTPQQLPGAVPALRTPQAAGSPPPRSASSPPPSPSVVGSLSSGSASLPAPSPSVVGSLSSGSASLPPPSPSVVGSLSSGSASLPPPLPDDGSHLVTESVPTFGARSSSVIAVPSATGGHPAGADAVPVPQALRQAAEQYLRYACTIGVDQVAAIAAIHEAADESS